jgi:dipeptidase E
LTALKVASPLRRILALGGGGFSAGPADAPLDAHVVTLTGVERPKLCLLPTASGDPREQIDRFNATFRPLGAITSSISLFRLGERPGMQVREHLLSQDAIYVGGGSMLNLIAVWRAHGIDTILREAWERGILLAGVSAGSMCWFEHGITTSFGAPRAAAGLGLVPGSNCVHYDTQPNRRPTYHDCLRTHAIQGGWGVDDGAALYFENGELVRVLAGRPGAGAMRVDAVSDHIVEVRLPADHLTEVPSRADPALAELRELRVTRARLSGTARLSRPA